MDISIEILDNRSQDILDHACIVFPYTKMMNIGQWVKACREAAQLTQTQLGDAVGKTKGNVSAWENNLHEPSYSQMLKIAELSKWAIPLPGLKNAESWPFEDISRQDYERLPIAEKKEISAILQMKVLRYTQSKSSAASA